LPGAKLLALATPVAFVIFLQFPVWRSRGLRQRIRHEVFYLGLPDNVSVPGDVPGDVVALVAARQPIPAIMRYRRANPGTSRQAASDVIGQIGAEVARYRVALGRPRVAALVEAGELSEALWLYWALDPGTSLAAARQAVRRIRREQDKSR
jgi:hypothetical protein